MAVTIKGGQLKTDDPILYLLSILKRMPVRLSNSIILTSIMESEAAIGLLGNFLCVNDAVASGVPIPYGRSHFLIANSEDGYMSLVPVGQSYPDSKESKEFIPKAFEAAMRCVKDWENHRITSSVIRTFLINDFSLI